MPFYTPPKRGDITFIAYYGIADNYLDELAAQLGKDKEQITSEQIRKCLTASLENAIYTQTFYDEIDNPRAVFGMSPSGAVTFVETRSLKPLLRAKWARRYATLIQILYHATGLRPWCYSDARNGKASRLLEWFKFAHMPCKDIVINGYKFYYYEYIPVAKPATA